MLLFPRWVGEDRPLRCPGGATAGQGSEATPAHLGRGGCVGLRVIPAAPHTHMLREAT